MFSPLSNMKVSDKTSKSSLRDVFEADVVCCEKTTSTSFAIIKIKRLTLMLTPYCKKRWSNLFVFWSEKYPLSLCEEVIYIDHLCLLQNFLRGRSMFWNYIGDGKIRVPHHFLKMSPYIQFVVGESLDSLWVLWILFLSSTNLFIESFLKILYELSICFDTIPSP